MDEGHQKGDADYAAPQETTVISRKRKAQDAFKNVGREECKRRSGGTGDWHIKESIDDKAAKRNDREKDDYSSRFYAGDGLV